ncbi:hypothetical protein QCA50_007925 [Cerrena zonata]|uniref:Uncharacterized protein n=1 Tax=Cerrena zonata TaxID=2478898 RepID=A0AAW0GC47_9APHY
MAKSRSTNKAHRRPTTASASQRRPTSVKRRSTPKRDRFTTRANQLFPFVFNAPGTVHKLNLREVEETLERVNEFNYMISTEFMLKSRQSPKSFQPGTIVRQEAEFRRSRGILARDILTIRLGVLLEEKYAREKISRDIEQSKYAEIAAAVERKIASLERAVGYTSTQSQMPSSANEKEYSPSPSSSEWSIPAYVTYPNSLVCGLGSIDVQRVSSKNTPSGPPVSPLRFPPARKFFELESGECTPCSSPTLYALSSPPYSG